MKKRVFNERNKKATSFFQKLTTFYISCMLGFFLLFAGNNYTSITLNKFMCFTILTGGYILISLIGRLELMAIGQMQSVKISALWKSMHISQKCIFIYWIISFVSTIFSVDFYTSLIGTARFEGFLTISLYCWLFLLISFDYVPKRSLLWIFGISMSINCIISIIQFMGYNPLGLYPSGMNYYDAFKLYSGAFLGTLGNIDIYSAMLCIAIPVLGISIFKLKSNLRFFLLIPLILCLFVLLKSFVAGGIVGVCFGTLCIIPVLQPQKEKRKVMFIAFVLSIVLILTGIFFLGEKVGGFIGEVSAILHGKWDDSFGSGRLYIWRKSIELIPARPLLGGGPETFDIRSDASFERVDEKTGLLIHSDVDTAHNEYLNILVNQGILAFIAYVIALVFAAKEWVKNASTNPISAICGGAVLCYSIQAFFGISSPISAPFFWICFAIVVKQNQLFKSNDL